MYTTYANERTQALYHWHDVVLMEKCENINIVEQQNKTAKKNSVEW